ncbi:hypothetical protein ACFW9D_18690 [Streptomyces sp. NPDC059524]|uniref:hypothetical protein n=1 Tax=Streptomyces sp. NPDC059524 TaxID=3346856 RepID=UPI0036C0460B
MISEYSNLVKQYENVLLAVTASVAAGGTLTLCMADELQRFPVVGHAYDNKLV